MSVDSISFKTSSIAPIWRQRLLLLLIVALFVLPLAVAWLLIGHWRPEGHVQHGELLDPARPMDLRLSSLEGKPMDGGALRGWMLVYVGLAAECDTHCRTGLYDMRQVRLALGKDMDRVKTLLLLDAIPATEFRGWLAAEHSATVVGVADAANRTS
ncbi:MAG: SCO family protein, partial [Candidatus Competibacter sp.]|nr:SCO family protein [Candidatus Competibacter sp.]